MSDPIPYTAYLICYGPLLLVVGGFIVFAALADRNARRTYLRNLDLRSDDEKGGRVTPNLITQQFSAQTPSGPVVTLKPAAAPAAPVAPPPPVAAAAAVAPDDLRKIEGVGPKINSILQDAGIRTFAQLAESDPEELRRILTDAGMSAINDPTTWPAQARLAAQGDWDALATFQDNLKGGRLS